MQAASISLSLMTPIGKSSKSNRTLHTGHVLFCLAHAYLYLRPHHTTLPFQEGVGMPPTGIRIEAEPTFR